MQVMRQGPGEIGLFRRVLVMLFGLMLWGNNISNPFAHAMLALVGLLIFLAGLGAIELGMALWYRSARRLALARHTRRDR
jgi:hypothetical protein